MVQKESQKSLDWRKREMFQKQVLGQETEIQGTGLVMRSVPKKKEP